MNTEKKENWLIAVGHGWGVIDGICSEQEAEEMRVHKANWEQAPALKIKYKDFILLKDEEIEKNWAYKMIRDFLQI